MAEYIEKTRLLERLTDYYNCAAMDYTIKLSVCTAADCLSIVKKAPVADVVEVVRCSECKYFGKELKQGKHSCLNYQLPYCLENDYCSYGERKDDDK